MRRLRYTVSGLFLILAALITGSDLAGAAATEPCGLEAMRQFDRLPYLKLDTIAGGQSSYDRAGGNADASNFLYTDGTEKVLLDLNGPGTVYRVWFTGFNQPTDYLKVYFDGETTPRINRLLKDIFVGTNAPFLGPLVGDDSVSSGGFYCYLPLPFNHSIKFVSNATAGSFYYNIGYHLYSQDTSVTTWTGAEDSGAVRTLWNNAINAGVDPKSSRGNTTVSDAFDLPAGATKTLLNVAGPRSISSIKLRIPGTEPQPAPPSLTDDGRANKGYSQFRMALNPANHGVTLARRLDYGIASQKADVYVDGALVGQWFDAGSDGSYHWRDSSFSIPATFTTNKNSIAIKVSFVSSDNDWNEFTYWTYSLVGGTSNLTDALDVGNAASESSHSYSVNTQTWSGTRTFEYPPPSPPASAGDLLTNLWLRIAFDDETNPSVFAPVGSFFGVGQFASYFTRALPVGLDAGTNFYCYFPMPFARRARVQLISQRRTPTTNLQCEIAYKPFTDSFANVGCFKADFCAETPTTNGSDIIFLDVDGAGHLVGVVENMMGPTSRAYLEGDERIYVDDSQSPALYGTGTEDFYNGGWYFDHGLFTCPTHGNPAHVADGSYDRTTAYRLFLADAVPFRKHIRAGIEHGAHNDVSENAWTVAYYYFQPATRAVLTDQLIIGNSSSETAHAYSINAQTWSGTRSYTYDGDFDDLVITNTGRAHKGTSQFTLSLFPINAGAILRRTFDQGVANQKANVYVDGALVGAWYRAGSNGVHSWRDDDFMIPASFTSGKSSIQVKVQFLSASNDWTEFAYKLYALKPAASAAARTARFTASNLADSGSLAFALNLPNWYSCFTDSAAPDYPRRFYQVIGP